MYLKSFVKPTRSAPPEMHFVDLFANVSWQVKAVYQMSNSSGERIRLLSSQICTLSTLKYDTLKKAIHRVYPRPCLPMWIMESARAERHCRIHKERLITSNSISSSRPGVSSTRPRRFKNPVTERKRACARTTAEEEIKDASLLSFSEIYSNWKWERIFAGRKEALEGRKAEKEG